MNLIMSKGNKAMRIAAATVAATMLSTCMVGGTFAKYTTSSTGTDTARVAKWGVTVSAPGTAFATSYAKSDSGYSGTNSVVSSNDDKVMAPGTSGSLTAATLTGTPEVAARITNSATVLLDGWDVGNNYYCPVTVTVGTQKIKGTAYTSAGDFKDAIETAINAYAIDVDPGTNLSTKSASPSVSWEWEFAGADGKQTNEKDTALGNLTTAPTLSISITTTVTQID